MREETRQKLTVLLPEGSIRYNGEYPYIPVEFYRNRVEEVCPDHNWILVRESFQTLEFNHTDTIEYLFTVVGRLEIEGTIREGIGTYQVPFRKSDKMPLNIGQGYSIATSDAFKEASKAFGVGVADLLLAKGKALPGQTKRTVTNLDTAATLCKKCSKAVTAEDISVSELVGSKFIFHKTCLPQYLQAKIPSY